ALMRDMWKTPHGLASAEHIAYQDIPLADYLTLPMLTTAATLIRRDAFGEKVSPEQDELAWRLAADIWTALRQGKVAQSHMVQLGLTWKGTTNFLGWGGVSPSLAPSLRGPLAYVMGHRFRRLGQAKQAAEFFRIAVSDAPSDSTLRALAQTELKGAE